MGLLYLYRQGVTYTDVITGFDLFECADNPCIEALWWGSEYQTESFLLSASSILRHLHYYINVY